MKRFVLPILGLSLASGCASDVLVYDPVGGRIPLDATTSRTTFGDGFASGVYEGVGPGGVEVALNLAVDLEMDNARGRAHVDLRFASRSSLFIRRESAAIEMLCDADAEGVSGYLGVEARPEEVRMATSWEIQPGSCGIIGDAPLRLFVQFEAPPDGFNP